MDVNEGGTSVKAVERSFSREHSCWMSIEQVTIQN